ncbi:excinuclease ABC subunit UvrC [Carboxylicivirga sp. M1479]|uniref:excinuclease ABC subunit UvrC n=1 Tax=Carboxylicivirga sp. M1479 TaxID=2594476 RepID=UPI001178A10D|nr:excinuclease ABC subunit UvrC [Carboxylicivirga sp. M1479]TRX71666.1 excinuclease ABC subunit UvrC [Carboxylicivirga sp. M1479]
MKNNEICREERLKLLVQSLPGTPGIYQYYNIDGAIIYIGKAKNLKKRVSSYFSKQHDDGKTRILVRKIYDIKHIVVDTEADALLLENNLIKKYQPRYNILLKDDKSFPYIVIRNERFPRVHQTRNFIRDGSAYFGPYTSVGMVRTLIELFRQIYPLRTCKHNLSEANIQNGKFRECLEFHIGKCKAPCVGSYAEENYLNNISSIKEILQGNISSVLKYMNDVMLTYASELEFELANEVKKKIELLKTYQSKSTVVNPKITNVDVFSIIDDEKTGYVNFIRVINGAIIQSHTMEFKKKLNENKDEILLMAIIEIKERLKILAREVLVPFDIDLEIENTKFVVPKIGDKKKLMDLSERNVKYFRLDKLKQQSLHKKEPREERLMKVMQADLRLKVLPRHIECFDNSNIQGTNPVAACVVFRNGKPYKKDYRHFNIKTVEGPNDFASMEEVVYRRYKRLKEEGQGLPQLVVVDGGKGQLGSAVRILSELGLMDKISVIGIAKRLEEIFYPGDPVPLYLDKNSETLKIIQHLRNEAHRFGITFHRQKRSINFIQSELNNIPGIGDKTIELLFKSFKSFNNIKDAKIENLREVVGNDKAKKVYSYFNSIKSV